MENTETQTGLEKMDFKTADGIDANIEKLAQIFPEAVTETKDANGKLVRVANLEALKELLEGKIADPNEQECYEFIWPGKSDAIMEAAKSITKTLRPCPEESKNWDSTQNLYIEGDNLEALKLLQQSYLGKVKMIYIDPPYNTGKDFVYRDNFHKSKSEYYEESTVRDEDDNKLVQNTESNGRFHSDWCSMIYPRLKLARDLLSDDGVIFISIDDHEIHNLRKICDEIFGEENFIATLIWDKNHSAQAGIFKVYHEYIVAFAKNIFLQETPNALNNELFEAGAIKKPSGRHILQEFTFPAGTRFDAPDNTEYSGSWGGLESLRLVRGRMRALNGKLVEDATIEAAYTQISQMKEFFYGNRDALLDSRGQKIKEFYLTSTGKVKVVKQRSVETPQTTCHFGAQGPISKELAALFEIPESPFDSPKPTKMVENFILRFSGKNDIILDFFGGSSTSAHAVLLTNLKNQSNRKFIIIQLPESLENAFKKATKDNKKTLEAAIKYLRAEGKPLLVSEIGKERIRRAGEKIKAEYATTAPNLDIGFRVLKVAESNMKDVYYSPAQTSQDLLDSLESNIKEDRTDLDLLFACLIDFGVELSLPLKSETIDGVSVHTVQSGEIPDIIACFAENIPESVVREIASRKPLRAVFRDSSFKDSPSKINVKEIFKYHSPNTTIKVL